MAEGKKSFVLYCDSINVFEQLSDKEAGLLIKHIFRYVNDQSPASENRIVNMAFEPIKQQLKRDLKEWQEKRVKRSEAGKTGGIKSGESRLTRSKRSNASKIEANEAVTVNVTDTVTVNGNVTVKRESSPQTVTNAETEILKNPIDFERIVMNAGREKSEGLKILHSYHLYLESHEKYPKTKKSVFAGFEKWIHDEKKFERNGTHQQTNRNGTKARGKSEGANNLLEIIRQDHERSGGKDS